ncbi:MAG: GNAT family N-acetyltransferase [Eubacterium sp.]|nr:GNAT family N-acetyltransferase [Eubacterium sp.]
MNVVYKCQKDLPCKDLYDLFCAVGWANGNTTPVMLENFNRNFINSTLVLSAWVDDKLVGCARVLSDKMFRSVIYDLAVLPAYQRMGIGKELVRRCIETYPNSEWLVQTETASAFYEKIGFSVNKDTFLTVPCKWF